MRIEDLSDNIGGNFSAVLSNGVVLRLNLDVAFRSDLAVACLNSLRCGFPPALFQTFWRLAIFLRKHDSSLQDSELGILERCVGYFLYTGFSGNPEYRQALTAAASAPASPPSDWDFLLASPLHASSQEKPWMRGLSYLPHHPPRPHNYADHSALFSTDFLPEMRGEFLNYLPSLLVCLHLVLEDQRLSTLTQHNVGRLESFLLQLAILLNSKIYQDYYLRGATSLTAATEGSLSIFLRAGLQGKVPSSLVLPTLFATPPDLLQWFVTVIRSPDAPRFPYPHDLVPHFNFPQHLLALSSTSTLCAQTKRWCDLFRKLLTSSSPSDVVIEMCQRKITQKDLDVLPTSLALAFQQALIRCHDNPPDNLPALAYTLIGRKDLLIFSDSPPKVGEIFVHSNVSFF